MASENLPKRLLSDEAWSDLVASFSADELVAGKLIASEQWDFARRIIAQQIFVQLVTNIYPAGDTHSV